MTITSPRPALMLSGHNDTLVWGMSNAERIRRLAEKSDISGGDDSADVIWADVHYAFDPLWFTYVIAHPGTVVTHGGKPLLAHMPRGEAAALEAGTIPAGAQMVTLESKPQLYNSQLRKLENPFFEPLTPASAAGIERKSYYGAYKGVTDILTKYLWPELALLLTRGAAKIGMTPNMVTGIGAIFCVAALYLFLIGQYWPGIAAGFVFMVLDTVDGKLARCTITSSKWGNIFDHGIDLVHPPFWWLAWGVGLKTWGLALTPPLFLWTMIVIFAGYVLQRLVEGRFLQRHKLDVHTWRPIDSWFRLITARRNPNMVLLIVAMLFKRPDLGLIAVAVWTALSLLFHLVQLLQAEYRVSRGHEITSWMEQKPVAEQRV